MGTHIASRTEVASHVGHRGHFLRHLGEMTLAMLVGMFLGGEVLILAAGRMAGRALTFDEAQQRYPELGVLALAVFSSILMVSWMRFRGHGWRSGGEMAAAMIVPALALCGLFWLHLVGGGLLCGIYCAVMIPAMVIAMLVRRSEYGGAPMPAHMTT